MPKLVKLADVLYEVYTWTDMETMTESERPLSYKGFKKIMLASELVVHEKTIRQKFEQVVASGYARENRQNPTIIIFDVPMVRTALISEMKIPSDSGRAHTHTRCADGAQTARTPAEVRI